VDQGGLKIYSTINLHDEQLAQQAVDSHEGGADNPAAALASIDPTNGHLLAIANTSKYSQTSFDYATQGRRQPGSSFKMFALMTLIHDYDGDPNQTYYNSHFLAAGWLPSIPSWSVHTAEQTYQGDISITKATIVSDNTVFAQLAVDEGMDKFDSIARSMGITSPLNANPAEVIGGLTFGVTPLEMADAYGTVANGGDHIPPTAVDKVVFPDGSTMNFGEPTHTQVFSYPETYEATSVLKQVITNAGGTGTAANYGCPAAGKTGTAENLANAWFVGYTPRLSTAVWVGYPSGNLPMANGFGGTLAAPIWHDYMQQASNGFCGDWNSPNVPWHGVQFVGGHSLSGPSNNTKNNGSGQYLNPYYNPALFAQPPQGTPTTRKSKSGNGAGRPPGGFGSGHLPGGGGGDNGTAKKH
jgi:penicillin-binding protein 1A